MNSPKLVVRRMAESELNLALEWAAAEGWNPGLHDAEASTPPIRKDSSSANSPAASR